MPKRGFLFSSLRRARLRAGLRLRDVSNETGIAVSTLSECERGLLRLSAEQSRRLKDALAQEAQRRPVAEGAP
jgi:transcriptional regulator with XRE-family HTH domain